MHYAQQAELLIPQTAMNLWVPSRALAHRHDQAGTCACLGLVLLSNSTADDDEPFAVKNPFIGRGSPVCC